MELTKEQEFIHFANNTFNISLGQTRILLYSLEDHSQELDRNALIERAKKIQLALEKALEMVDALKVNKI